MWNAFKARVRAAIVVFFAGIVQRWGYAVVQQDALSDASYSVVVLDRYARRSGHLNGVRQQQTRCQEKILAGLHAIQSYLHDSQNISEDRPEPVGGYWRNVEARR